MKPLPTDRNKLWKKATIVKQVAPRSYQVDSPGSVYRRNRRHLVKTKESQQLMPEPEMPSPAKEIQSTVSEEACLSSPPVKEARAFLSTPSKVTLTSPVLRIRSGRTVRPPLRFQDCV